MNWFGDFILVLYLGSIHKSKTELIKSHGCFLRSSKRPVGFVACEGARTKGVSQNHHFRIYCPACKHLGELLLTHEFFSSKQVVNLAKFMILPSKCICLLNLYLHTHMSYVFIQYFSACEETFHILLHLASFAFRLSSIISKKIESILRSARFTLYP